MGCNILILSSPLDPHAQAVKDHLAAMGIGVSFWEMADLLGRTRLKHTITASDPSCELVVDENDGESSHNRIDLMSIQSIWLRRPGNVKVASLPEKWMESLVEWECTRALSGIFRAVPCLWVNPPQCEHDALLKLKQLDVARKCGLTVPETLVTNDPNAVSAFHDKHKGQIIYKLIDEGSYRFFPPYEIVTGMPTLPFRPSDLSHIDQISLSLHLFQERIDKVSDIRVTVVGTRIFAAEILSQEGKGKIDFRLDYSVPMRAHELPEEIAQGCLNVLRQLGLTFGAFDFCLDRDGQYVFLEVNPSGQWLWMEKGLNLPISLHLARLLAGLESPLEPGT